MNHFRARGKAATVEQALTCEPICNKQWQQSRGNTKTMCHQTFCYGGGCSFYSGQERTFHHNVIFAKTRTYSNFFIGLPRTPSRYIFTSVINTLATDFDCALKIAQRRLSFLHYHRSKTKLCPQTVRVAFDVILKRYLPQLFFGIRPLGFIVANPTIHIANIVAVLTRGITPGRDPFCHMSCQIMHSWKKLKEHDGKRV